MRQIGNTTGVWQKPLALQRALGCVAGINVCKLHKECLSMHAVIRLLEQTGVTVVGQPQECGLKLWWNALQGWSADKAAQEQNFTQQWADRAAQARNGIQQ